MGKVIVLVGGPHDGLAVKLDDAAAGWPSAIRMARPDEGLSADFRPGSTVIDAGQRYAWYYSTYNAGQDGRMRYRYNAGGQ